MADWKRGTGIAALLGSTNSSLIDDYVTDYLQDPLDRMLISYRRGCVVRYTSASSVTIGAGELTLRNSADTIKRFRANTAEVVLDLTTDLDTGAEAATTQYYVYAVADAAATTFTGIISASATFPTGVTYARKIGYFYNDASSNITSVGNIDGDESNLVYAYGIGDITTTYFTGGWDTISNFTLNFIAKGGKLSKIIVSLPLNIYGYGWVKVLDNGAQVGLGNFNMPYSVAALVPQMTTIILPYVFSAGAHVITVQLKGASTAYGYSHTIATNGERIIMVEE
jgi:hypothetical protein